MMTSDFFFNPALTLALGLIIGIIAQSSAFHLKIPGIVILLVSGVLLGPDVAGIIQPGALGEGLQILTGFAVAIILFEGGMSLKLSRLRREQKSIRRLLTAGGVITVTGGMLAARYVLEWKWQQAFLFGTLVMVTGPTVISPLLRRIKVKRNVATVLEAEGVLIDAIGAIIATVALEATLAPPDSGIALWFHHFITRIGAGTLTGILAGLLLVGIFRARHIIPEGMEKVFTLSFVLAVFQLSNALLPESGIAAVTVAGIVTGNFPMPVTRELSEFKEEMTVMLIGLLFVLLAADVRMEKVYHIGMPGLLTVLILMAVVRPLAVFLSTAGTDLTNREKIFIAWIGPRGIVAAAVASLFASQLRGHGFEDGESLRAMVFMVITVTVLWAGLTGGIISNILGLRRPVDSGWVILGANEVARTFAKLLKADGEETVSIDANPDACAAAQQDCTRVIFGNGLKTRYLLRAEVETRAGVLAVTPNEEVNLLFIQKVRRTSKGRRLYMAIRQNSEKITPGMAHQQGASVLFGAGQDIDLWAVRIRRNLVRLQHWTVPEAAKPDIGKQLVARSLSSLDFIILTFRRNGKVMPFGDQARLRGGDTLGFIVFEEHSDMVEEQLVSEGWQRETDEGFSPSTCPLPEHITETL